MRDEGHLAPNTIRHREVVVKSFCEFLCSAASGNIRAIDSFPYPATPAHPVGKLISAPATRKVARSITAEEVIQLLKGLNNECERLLIHTLFDTGMRISEAARLRLSDLPNEKNFPEGLKYYPLHIPGSKGRGGAIKERYAMISAPTLARIRRYHQTLEYRLTSHFDRRDPDKPAFLTINGRAWSERNALAQIKRAAERSGLSKSLYSPHKFRHGAAYDYLRSDLGEDYVERLATVKELFGHKLISTTELYTRIPVTMLSKLSAGDKLVDRFEEHKRILEETFLPPRLHTEKRGHR